MRHIYDNAIDSLAVGMQFYLSDDNASSRKHAILTLFHAIELLLKEYLYRINPILIYKNIDKKITEDSITVGLAESLVRLENLNLGIPDEQEAILRKIQKRRNRIEHHRYDKKQEDEKIIAESLKFILFFVEEILQERLDNDIQANLIVNIQNVILDYYERHGIVHKRIEKYIQSKWPEWEPCTMDLPEDFEGTLECPVCQYESLVFEQGQHPFCFWCNTRVEVTECETCGVTYLTEEEHEC